MAPSSCAGSRMPARRSPACAARSATSRSRNTVRSISPQWMRLPTPWTPISTRPDALAVIFDLAREINTQRASGGLTEELNTRRRTLVHLLEVLGLDVRSEAPTDQPHIDPYVELLLEVRRKLRDLKQWALADEIRTRLGDLGVTVEDRPGGESTWHLDNF